MKSAILSISILSLALITTSCSKSSDSSSAGSSEDTSTSGSVASAIGGAYNGSTGGTVASLDRKKQNDSIQQWLASLNPIASAQAATACSTFDSTSLTACLLNDSTLSNTYSDCSFGSSTAVWNGGVTLSCSGHDSVTRAETNGTTRTNSFGSVLTINTTELTTYSGSGATVAGGGTTLTTAGSLSIGGVQLSAVSSGGIPLYDHTITTGNTPLTLNTVTKKVTGQVTTYHNLVHATATSTVNVTFQSGCCTPVSGTISTVFTSSSLLGAKFNGATETLQFTGCGQATYSGPEGLSANVTLANCI